MKFYYKDKLVRTSKNQHYTHAVITESEKGIGVWACASRRDLAEKAMQKEINWHSAQGDNLREHIKAIENGKKEYYCHGRYYKTSPKDDADALRRYLAEHEERIAEMRATFKIVELEER